jgi:hypothetical protein
MPSTVSKLVELLMSEHPEAPDAVPLLGVVSVRGELVSIAAASPTPGDERGQRAMLFAAEDVIAHRPVAQTPGAKSVVLVSGRAMQTAVLDAAERQALAARFLTGEIGGDLLIPGTAEGAAWRLKLAVSVDPRDCIETCSIAKRSPRC